MSANGNVYVFSRQTVAIPNAITTILQIKAGAAKPIEILRAWASQVSSTTSTQVQIGLVRLSVAGTVTAAVAADVKVTNPSDGASGVQLGTSATGYLATAEGTVSDMTYPDNFNILNGWLYLPVPEERIIVPGAGLLALKFLAAPGGAWNWSAGIVFRELG